MVSQLKNTKDESGNEAPGLDENLGELRQIFFKSPQGESYAINCHENMKVSGCKKLYEQRTGMLAGQQRLIFRGKQLDDHTTLKDNKIEKASNIVVTGRLRGD